LSRHVARHGRVILLPHYCPLMPVPREGLRIFVVLRALRRLSLKPDVSFGICHRTLLTSSRLNTGGVCSRIGCDSDGMSLITFVIALMLPLKNVLTDMRSASAIFAKAALVGQAHHTENGPDGAVSRTQNHSHKEKLNMLPNAGGEESTKATQDCRSGFWYSQHGLLGVRMNTIRLTSFFYRVAR